MAQRSRYHLQAVRLPVYHTIAFEGKVMKVMLLWLSVVSRNANPLIRILNTHERKAGSDSAAVLADRYAEVFAKPEFLMRLIY